jgi:hypothetical protein
MSWQNQAAKVSNVEAHFCPQLLGDDVFLQFSIYLVSSIVCDDLLYMEGPMTSPPTPGIERIGFLS